MKQELRERFAGIDRLYGQGAVERFASSRVAVVGLGGVGSWVGEALARSGVGHLTLIDADDICVSNTNRQLPALEGQYGRNKCDAMADRCRAINPLIEVDANPSFVTAANLEALLKGLPLVGQACAIGDDKPFVSALIALDPEKLKPWATRRGLNDLSLAAAAKHPDVIAEIEAALPAAMASMNNAERVKRLSILSEEWLPDSDELTPTSKLKRRVIHKKYAAEIAAMYASTLAPPALAAAEGGSERSTG
jgi:hypothetical protein